tara:strand:- start:2639 stop:3340 length:702 start_codon:yes stop_codon:yes gene_type:complete
MNRIPIASRIVDSDTETRTITVFSNDINGVITTEVDIFNKSEETKVTEQHKSSSTAYFNTNNLIVLNDQAISLGGSLEGRLIMSSHEGDVDAVLPQASNHYNGNVFKIARKNAVGTRLRIVPFGDDTIDGQSEISHFGNGSVEVMLINGDWFVMERYNYNEVPMQGMSRIFEFENESQVTITHNLGYIPIVQAWVSDGSNSFVDANVDVDHDWVNMNSFTASFSTPETGKIIY